MGSHKKLWPKRACKAHFIGAESLLKSNSNYGTTVYRSQPVSKLSDIFKAVFKPQSAAAEAAKEVEMAKKELLRHQAAADYHARMSEYCIASIRRLSGFIREEQK